MELQFIMDGGADALNGTIWFPNTLSPSYEQLSPVRQSRCDAIATQHASFNVIQLASMGYHSAQNSLWQDKYNSPKDPLELGVQIRSNSGSPEQLSPSSDQAANCQQSSLKRRAGESLQIVELERKHARRDGSVGSNGSGQGWSTQVEELAEHLAADFDGSLSALAASDLATAVASYNMSEALLALPSLTVFKQEAPSPENQQNSNLNHVSQTMIISAPPNTTSGSVEAESNGQTAASLHQLLNSTSEKNPPTSSSGNHVSSSQQGNEINEDCRFQYVLAAATSIATKMNEETLTYLNQGQSYEVKLKKLGDLSAYRGKILKSTIRICFHERRLQYTEREQMLAWQRARPGERLLEVDVPLSYGMVEVCQPSPSNNTVEFMWDPTKEVGVYIKVNCISTEFTPKKHGGEKGVSFRILVETKLPGGPRLHAASCQVKVFKLKGADRKHKQDRDKILRRPAHEQDKYQPSYDCTVLSDIPLESITPSNWITQTGGSPYASTDAVTRRGKPMRGGLVSLTIRKGKCNRRINAKGITKLIYNSNRRHISPQSRWTVSGNTSPVLAALATEAVKENMVISPALPPPAAILPDQSCVETEVTGPVSLSPDANASETTAWLRARRFGAVETAFANFTAVDMLELSRDDLIQICGLAEGIRLFNSLHPKPLGRKLSLYFALEDEGMEHNWKVVYLESLTSNALISQLQSTLNLPSDRQHSVVCLGPRGIHVLITDEFVAHMEDETMYVVEIVKGNTSERCKLLLKPWMHF